MKCLLKIFFHFFVLTHAIHNHFLQNLENKNKKKMGKLKPLKIPLCRDNYHLCRFFQALSEYKHTLHHIHDIIHAVLSTCQLSQNQLPMLKPARLLRFPRRCPPETRYPTTFSLTVFGSALKSFA